MQRHARWIATIGAAAIGLCLYLASPSAVMAATHGFDPVLSLTGDCSTSSVDEVPDPGCPGGAHPPAPFSAPKSITVDSHGDIYVASYGTNGAGGSEGRIDVFDPTGHFLFDLVDEGGPESIAVDSIGNLYVFEHGSSDQVSRFAPTRYEPATGEIEYGNPPIVVAEEESPLFFLPLNTGIAIDSADDHLFVDYGEFVAEFGSATEGNPLLNSTIGGGSLPGGETLRNSHWIAIDASRRLLYVSSAAETAGLQSKVQVFEADSPYDYVRTIDGSTSPAGRFMTAAGTISIAVDEGNGHVFIDDMERTGTVYEFTETGEYVSTITHNFQYVFPSQIAMDNGAESPNGALNPFGRYLFVPSNESGVGHSFAFAPLREGPPIVEGVSAGGATETEVELHGRITPDGGATRYRFEFVSAQRFKENGFAAAAVGGEGALPAETTALEVSASLEGLAPGVSYRFRLVAQNSQGEDEEEGVFGTYPQAPQAGSCPNEAVRAGLSAGLPDCRAYELVTPPDTGGRPLYDPENNGAGDRFGTLTVSPSGSNVAFATAGGAIPGTEASGAFNGSPYLAQRSAGGWSLESVGLSGSEASAPDPGGLSPEHGYMVNSAVGVGNLPIEGKKTRYLRLPDGELDLLGQGSLGSEPAVHADFIGPNGAHEIFATGSEGPARRLEPQSPPAGTAAIYDRTADGTIHVVSLLPGEAIPVAGQDARYQGASASGDAIAFKLEPEATSPLYLRLNDAETLEAAPGGATFAGFSGNGRYAFYLFGGDLFRYDTSARAALRITSTADATVVNVPTGGSTVYFTSPSVISGAVTNPNGPPPQVGKENLYFWNEAGTGFVGTLTDRDVVGEFTGPGGYQTDGLGLWTSSLTDGNSAIDPSRATPDGGVFVFESRAELSDFESSGHAEVYRFDAPADRLSCLSCDPLGLPATSDASLQSPNPVGNAGAPQPTSQFAIVPDLSTNGRRVFFETADPLVVSDTDGVRDVYEWEANGEGSCVGGEGCIYLISSGHSARDNYLYGVSESGDDVFISTTDLLLDADHDATPSIYDARVGGGFAEVSEAECLGEGCRPSLTSAPSLPPPASSPSETSGNVVKRCPRHKKKAKRKGRVVCVAKSKRHKKSSRRHHHRREPHAKHGRRTRR